MEQYVFLLVMSCVWAFAGYRMALGKNRSPWLGVALGFLLGLIGLIILAFVPTRVEYAYAEARSYPDGATAGEPLFRKLDEPGQAA